MDAGVLDIVPLNSCSLSGAVGLDGGVLNIILCSPCGLSGAVELDGGVLNVIFCSSCSLSTWGTSSSALDRLLEGNVGGLNIIPTLEESKKTSGSHNV